MSSNNVSSNDDFLCDENLCGATLLHLVSHGSFLVTNLMDLADQIPPVFYLAAEKQEAEYNKKKKESMSSSLLENDNYYSLSSKFWTLFSSSSSQPSEDSDKAKAAQSSSSSKRQNSSIFNEYNQQRRYEIQNRDSGKVGTDNSNDINGDERFCRLLFDFSYLNSPEEHERLINDIPDNVELEASFSFTHRDILIKFYNLFEKFYQYYLDLQKLSKDLDQGYYIQYSIDSVLLDNNGRQLLCEAVYLYGLILLLMDRFIPGPVRERIIVAFFRYCGKEGNLINIDQVCKLCRATTYNNNNVSTELSPSSPDKSPSKATTTTLNKPIHHYEDKLFSRFPLPSELVRNVIGRIISDDIYMQSIAFPSFDHRSTRLTKQASMLFVVLFFQPHILHDECGTMREVVDKFFSDNWVISIHMGITIDLSQEWQHYRAAQEALKNVLQISNVKRLHENNALAIKTCCFKLDNYLKRQQLKAFLTDSYILDHTNELLHFMRCCNVALRWRLLHRNVTNEEFHDIINISSNNTSDRKSTVGSSRNVSSSPMRSAESSYITEGDNCDTVIKDSHVVSLLLQSSIFDIQLKEIFTRLLETKADKWKEFREKAQERLTELSEYFTGEQALTRVSRNEKMTAWFASMADEIKNLGYGEEHSTVTGQRIQRYIQTLEDVEQYDVIDRNLQVKTFLKDTKDLLRQMVKAVSIKEDIIKILDDVSDMSYSWNIIHDYVPAIHTHIRREPPTAVYLKELFLKLSQSLYIPIYRMKQLTNNKKRSVIYSKEEMVQKATDFFTPQLLFFAKNVLEVIPKCIFDIIMRIAEIKANGIRHLPVKIQVDEIKGYSQLNQRYNLAKLTYEASFFTKAVSVLEDTPLSIHPREIFLDCIRRELVRRVSLDMHYGLVFDIPQDSEVKTLIKYRASIMRSLSILANRIDGYRRAIEYIQDYINIPGLKIWGEEFSRIMNFYSEIESECYDDTTDSPKKIINNNNKNNHNNRYQSEKFPIPLFPSTKYDPHCKSFIGRIMTALLRLTDSQTTIYSRDYIAWYLKDGIEMCSVSTFALLRKTVGPAGLKAIDKLLCYRIESELKMFFKFYASAVKQSTSAVLIQQVREMLFPEWKTPQNTLFYGKVVKKMEKTILTPTGICLRRVGQAQLLRKMIRHELQLSSRVDVNVLYQSVVTLNSSVMADIQSFYNRPSVISRNVLPESVSNISQELIQLLDACGEGDPLQSIFVKAEPLEGLPLVLLMFTISFLPKFVYDDDFGALVRLNDEVPFDGWPIVTGMATLLKQFHPSYAKSLLGYISQFITSVKTGIVNSADNTTASTGASRGVGTSSTGSIPQYNSLSSLNNMNIFLRQLCSISNVPSSVVHSFIPQYNFEMGPED